MTLDEYEKWYRKRYHRTSSAVTNITMICSDFLAIMLSFGTGFFLVNLYDYSAINFKSFVTYWVYLPVFVLVFQIENLYPGVSLAPSEELRRFFIGSLMAHGGIIFSKYIEENRYDAISAALSLSFFFSVFYLQIFRSFFRWLLHRTKSGGIPAVIYGGKTMGKLIADKLTDNRALGYNPVLILEEDAAGEEEYRGIPICAGIYSGREIVRRFNIKVAIVAISHISRKDLVSLVNNSVSAFRYNILIPDFFGITTIWSSARDFDGIFGLATSQKLKIPLNLYVKRFTDLFISVAGGAVILPFLLVIAILIKCTSKGPVLYRHKRVGMHGREFYAYKFRTMVVDADKILERLLSDDPRARLEWEASQKLKDDPRVTGFGRFLRKMSLDEFPQILNVIQGDMSLVGPRPIVQSEIPKYGEDFNRIFSVKPGITGLWQVSGRSETDYAGRVSFDTYYLQNWSIWLDLWILYKTFRAVLAGRGAY